MSPDMRITITEAVDYVVSRTGQVRSRQTLYNWINKGVAVAGQKVKLQAVSLTGQTFTCREWVDEFLAKVDQQ